MIRRAVTGALWLGLVASCGGGGAADAGPPTAPVTSDCVIGWWTGPPGGCGSICAGASPRPECDAGDCQVMTFDGFEDAGIGLQGAITLSAAARQFSAWTSPEIGFWFVPDAGELILPGGAIALPAECSATALDVNGALSTRAAPDLAIGLEAAYATGQWSGAKY